MTTGEKIRKARKDRGFTQADLAAAMKVTPQAICRIELGKYNITLKSLQRLSTAINAPVNELIGDDIGSYTGEALGTAESQLERNLIESFYKLSHANQELLAKIAEALIPTPRGE